MALKGGAPDMLCCSIELTASVIYHASKSNQRQENNLSKLASPDRACDPTAYPFPLLLLSFIFDEEWFRVCFYFSFVGVMVHVFT